MLIQHIQHRTLGAMLDQYINRGIPLNPCIHLDAITLTTLDVQSILLR